MILMQYEGLVRELGIIIAGKKRFIVNSGNDLNMQSNAENTSAGQWIIHKPCGHGRRGVYQMPILQHKPYLVK